MGLELLVLGEGADPFCVSFNAARECARYGRLAAKWEFAIGLYPNRDDLVIAVREDELGPLETRQIYSYAAGIMQSGDVTFSFTYETFVFGINLSRPTAQEYIEQFNALNNFELESRWKLFS
jgi:hypothetical protein